MENTQINWLLFLRDSGLALGIALCIPILLTSVYDVCIPYPESDHTEENSAYQAGMRQVHCIRVVSDVLAGSVAIGLSAWVSSLVISMGLLWGGMLTLLITVMSHAMWITPGIRLLAVFCVLLALTLRAQINRGI